MVENYLNYPSVEQWLSRLALSTQQTQGNFFNAFMKWKAQNGGRFKDYSPDQLIEFQKENKDYTLLDELIQPYVRAKKGTFNSKKSRYNNIRSFFKHNRAELPEDPTFSITPEREPVRGNLTVEQIRDVILSCNPMYQAMFSCMFQAAMDQEMAQYWSINGYDDLRAQLSKNPEIIKVELPGRKANKNIQPYYTFIGGNAINYLETWLKHRDNYVKLGKVDPENKHIFVSNLGSPISKRSIREYWLKHLRKLGIVEPIKRGSRASRTGKGLHEMRDVFRSQWSLSPAKHLMGEYFMGHSIDKLEYDKSFRDVEAYRSEYEKALPFLQLWSRGEPYGLVEKSEINRIEKTQQQEMNELKAKLERMEKALAAIYEDTKPKK